MSCMYYSIYYSISSSYSSFTSFNYIRVGNG